MLGDFFCGETAQDEKNAVRHITAIDKKMNSFFMSEMFLCVNIAGFSVAYFVVKCNMEEN